MTTNEQTKPQKMMYIPYMCDHVYILGAALAAHNIPNEILPTTTDDTRSVGLDLCKGRECSPCLTTTGDLICHARQPDFDPARSILMMPTAMGSCRFGQYHVLQKSILEQNGLGEVELFSPTAANSYQGFGENPTQLRQLIWQGSVAVDLLQKLLHEYRPYETNVGQTDQVYQQCLDRVVDSVREHGGSRLIKTMQWVAQQFEDLPIDRSTRRPMIGLIGEIYLRFNTYSNQDIIRKIESAGGEVMIASMMEWFYYTNWNFKSKSRALGQYKDFVVTFLTDIYQQHLERNILKPVEHLLTFPHESPVGQLMDNIRPYYHPDLSSEAVLSMGKAIDFAQHGISGIINIMPFSCMPGIITAGMAARLREDLDQIPWLDVIYDTQGATNVNTRMEAFMYQALQFQRRKVAQPHSVA